MCIGHMAHTVPFHTRDMSDSTFQNGGISWNHPLTCTRDHTVFLKTQGKPEYGLEYDMFSSMVMFFSGTGSVGGEHLFKKAGPKIWRVTEAPFKWLGKTEVSCLFLIILLYF
jgi:hypothetical protein